MMLGPPPFDPPKLSVEELIEAVAPPKELRDVFMYGRRDRFEVMVVLFQKILELYGPENARVGPAESLLRQLVSLLGSVLDAHKLESVHNVRIGDKQREAKRTLDVLRRITTWQDEIVDERTRNDRNHTPLEELEGQLVRRARDLDESWRSIGEALGMTAQGAQQKHAGKWWMIDYKSTDASDDGPDQEEG